MPILTVPKPLRNKLGDEAVESLVTFLNEAGGEHKNEVLQASEDKFERRLTEVASKFEIKIEQVKSELEVKIEQVKSGLEVKIEQVKSELEVKIEQSKTELIRWMFIFWLGQMISITGILFTFFK